jgi:hypothetical protein
MRHSIEQQPRTRPSSSDIPERSRQGSTLGLPRNRPVLDAVEVDEMGFAETSRNAPVAAEILRSYADSIRYFAK